MGLGNIARSYFPAKTISEVYYAHFTARKVDLVSDPGFDAQGISLN